MPSALQPGSIIDRSYRLIDYLGEGGMGTVFIAGQLINNQTVALKLVAGRLHGESGGLTSAELENRLALAREFQTLASLHHPNVIRVQSYGFDEELGSYFTMELLASARTILEAAENQSEETKVRYIAQLLRALVYIHRRGVIHRDIKPGNVLVVGDEVKLLDFGIATDDTASSGIAGTIEYMAPELLDGEQPSVRSDLYAVGVVFHQMLTGAFPSTGRSVSSLLDDILGEDSGPPFGGDYGTQPIAGASASTDLEPGLPGALEPFGEPEPLIEVAGPLGAFVAKLLRRDPRERFDSAVTALRELAATVPYELPIETAATRESFLQATVLIGRESELSMLTGAIERTKVRVGAAYLVGGESGVGKSRLLSELRTMALVHGSWVVEGQSVTEGGYLYQEWLPLLRALCFRVEMTDLEASILKDLLPEISTLLGRPIPASPVIKPEARPARVAATLLDLLRRMTRPLLLILEDLHWGRSESLALLAEIAKEVHGLPLLIIGTYRSDESPNLPKSLPSLQPIALHRLGRPDIAHLSESMLGPIGRSAQLIDYLDRQTEGNVFFLIEIVRALAENAGELERIGQGELPEDVLTVGIERIVERRVDRVSAFYRPLLEFSATLGRKLDLGALQHVFPRAPLRDFLIECANAAVLESQGNEWRFAHDKLREGILRQIDPAERQRLHGEIAETLETLYTGKEREALSAVLALHYKEAGVPEKAIYYYLLAGDSATKLYTYEQARTYFAAALGLFPQVPESAALTRLRIDTLLKQVQCSLTFAPPQTNLERLALLRSLLDSLRDAAPDPADRLRAVRADYYNARVLNYSGQPAEAMPYFKKVLPIAQEEGIQELVLTASIFIGLAMFQQGQMVKVIEILQPLLVPMKNLNGKDIDTLRAYTYTAMAMSANGQHATGQVLADEAASWVREVNQVTYTAVFYMMESIRYLLAGDWPQSIRSSKKLFDLGEAASEIIPQYLCRDCSGWAHSNLGMHEAALADRAKAVALRRSIGGGGLKDWYDAGEAEIYLNAGRLSDALEQARSTAASSRAKSFRFSLAVAERVTAAALARLGHDMAEVDSHFQESLDICDGAGLVSEGLQTELWWGRICRERGEHAAAEAHFLRARGRMTDGMAPYTREAALRIITGNLPTMSAPGIKGVHGGPDKDSASSDFAAERESENSSESC